MKLKASNRITFWKTSIEVVLPNLSKVLREGRISVSRNYNREKFSESTILVSLLDFDHKVKFPYPVWYFPSMIPYFLEHTSPFA